MSTTDFSKELLFKITELGFSGYHAIGKGVVFILEQKEDPIFYLKQSYIEQVKQVSDSQKIIIREHLDSYNHQIEIIVFNLDEVVLLNAFTHTGKTLDNYAPKPTKNKKVIPAPRK